MPHTRNTMSDGAHKIPSLLREYSAAIDDQLRAALMHDAGCAVAVLETEGTIHECNGAFAYLFGESTPKDLIGTHFQSLLDDAESCTLDQAMQHVLVHDEPVVVDGVLGERFVRTTYRSMLTEHTDSVCVLVVIAPFEPDTAPPSSAHLLCTQATCRDPIGSLTPRERDVLRHIGMGLPTAEIARQLHRSVKTIEGHRVSLGLKLGVANRVQLARIAIRSGLSPLSASTIEPKPEPAAD